MTVLLVDGSNVARCDAWRAHVEQELREHGVARPSDEEFHATASSRLLDWILHWTTTRDVDVVVVFDGAGPVGVGDHEWLPRYHVIGSGSEDGDSVVEREAARLAKARRAFQLVTNDRTLATVAGAKAEVVLGVDGFVAAITTMQQDDRVERSADVYQYERPSRLADTMADDVRARLERMRRGLDG